MGTVQSLVDALVERPESEGRTLALIVMKDGEVIAERYGSSPDTPFGPGEPVTPLSTLISWSMAKSITHALIGIAMNDGLLDVNDVAPLRSLQVDGQPPIR